MASRRFISKPVLKGIGGFASFVGTVVGILAAFSIPPFGGTENALAAAAKKATDAGSARIDLSETIQSGSRTVSVGARGPFDFRAGEGVFDLSNPPGSRLVLRKPFLYLRGIATQKDTWCRYDLSRLGSGFNFGAVTGFSPDPAQALENLRHSKDTKKVGKEQLFGVESEHYHGTVNLEDAARRSDEQTRDQLLKMIHEAHITSIPVDVWVSQDGLVQRIRTAFSQLAVPGSGSSGKVTVDVTMDFSKFGVNVVAPQPPEAKTAGPNTAGCPNIFS